MAKTKTLSVYPNPFHALDHNGRPSGVLPYEPEGDGVTTFDSRSFVGAHVQAEIIQKFPTGDARQTVQKTTFKYTDEAVTVRNTPYYRQAIQRGELIAADELTSLTVGQKTFMDVKKALDSARESAMGLWERQAHEEHDEEPPEELTSFAFGPMDEAIKVRTEAEKQSKVDAQAATEKDKAAKEEASRLKAAKKKAAQEVAMKEGGGDLKAPPAPPLHQKTHNKPEGGE